MHRILLLLLLLTALASCESAPRDGHDLSQDADELERMAHERTGDVRVYYYVKPAIVDSAHYRGTKTEQKRQLQILVNRSHAHYQGKSEQQMLPEEFYLFNADMHDLLVVLRDQMGFFEKGNAINILGEDPLARADRDPDVGRVIAVQQIKDGKVNTSYFARRLREDTIDPRRARTFNKCQELLLLNVIPKAIPRGSAEQGKAREGALGKR